MKSEFAFINYVRARAARESVRGLVYGIGDDTAILSEESGRETLVTTDLLIEDVHFKLDYTPPRLLGHKALAVSLSDTAAMGGAPRFALLSLAIPKSEVGSRESEEFWGEFFAGYFALAARFGVALVGGDTSASPDRLVIDSVVIGNCAEGRAVRRGGAQVGDAVFVTGRLGASAAGLELFRRGERVSEQNDSLIQRALRAHLTPQPRVEFGRLVGDGGLAHAMMDVSDGLAQDLAHICEESGVAATVDFEAVPVADEVALVAADEQAKFDLAVGGGEDYELLLTAPPRAEAELMRGAGECRISLARVGEIVARKTSAGGSNLFLRRGEEVRPFDVRGYDHFA
jgi:thiamine-monophosphate kinase